MVLDVASQVCITRDNTQLKVDGVLYYQVTDPRQASYGSANYVLAISNLAQTSLRSVIGKLAMDETFEKRDLINLAVRSEERRVGKECVSTGRSRWSP